MQSTEGGGPGRTDRSGASAESESARLRAAGVPSLLWHKVDDLSPAQVAAMQTMDDARRAGVLTDEEASQIERMIRAGSVHGARKRVTAARKRARS